jgi:peroxiredoxin
MVASCGEDKEQPVLKGPAPTSCIQQIQKDHPGKLLILLLGSATSSETIKSCAVLDEYIQTKPNESAVVFVDVPSNAVSGNFSAKWLHRFTRIADKGRVLADKLSFLYSPTLYIFDKDGVLRFRGGCELHEFSSIVDDILQEKTDSPKRIYSRLMPKKGSKAPLFLGKNIDGSEINLPAISGKRGILIVFVRAASSTSIKEFEDLDSLAFPLGQEGFPTLVVINNEEDASFERLKKYSDVMTLIPDLHNSIFNKYAISTTPYFYLIDNSGTVLAHRSFTKGAVIKTVDKYLGEIRTNDSYNCFSGG